MNLQKFLETTRMLVNYLVHAQWDAKSAEFPGELVLHGSLNGTEKECLSNILVAGATSSVVAMSCFVS